MRSTTRPALLLAVAAALLLGAGCTTTVAGSAAPGDGVPPASPPGAAAPGGTAAPGAAPAAGDGVSWVDGLCGGLLPFVRTAADEPPLSASSDVTALLTGITTYVRDASKAADVAAKDISALGPSPIAGGDEVAAEIVKTLTSFHTKFEDVSTRLAAIDPSNQRAIATELPAAMAPMEDLATLADPTIALKTNPELDRAAEQAARCKELEVVAG